MRLRGYFIELVLVILVFCGVGLVYGATTSSKFTSTSIPEVGDTGTGWATNLRAFLLSVDAQFDLIEGLEIKATGVTTDWVLAADGSNGTKWKADAGASGGDPDQNLWDDVIPDTGVTVTAGSTTADLTITGGAGVSTAGSNSSDTLTITVDHDAIANYVSTEHIDWTADQGATNIHSGNYTDTDTTYSAGTGIDLTGTVFSYNGNFSGVGGSITDAQVPDNITISSIPAANIAGSIADAQIVAAIARDTELFGGNFSDLAGSIATAQVPTDITIDARTIAQGGTSATTASGARTALGLAIGSDVQGWDAQLDDLADGQLSGAGTVADTALASTNMLDAEWTAATLTAAGKVELATTTESITGTDATRAVTPDGLTDAQASYHAGRAERPIAATVLYPTAGSVWPLIKMPYAITITAMEAVSVGGTDMLVNAQELTATYGTATDVATSYITADSDGASATTIANGAIAADNWLAIIFSTATGTPSAVNLTIEYTRD